MSALAGLLYRDRRPPELAHLAGLSAVNCLHGPDAKGQFVDAGVALLFHGLHFDTHSRHERQPWRSPSGLVVTLDGRLDHRDDVIQQFWRILPPDPGDAAIVGTALDHWGLDALGRLCGDFSVAIWSPKTEEITLARDAFGNRPLHYATCDAGYLWSTCLDTLVALLHLEDSLNDDYIASELTFGGMADATPFRGIARVAFNTALTIGRAGIVKRSPVWPEQPARIQYSRPESYQEHFRQVLRDAVRARLRTDRPVWCELSGGLDSSAVVCVAAERGVERPPLRAMSLVPDNSPESDPRDLIDEVAAWTGVPVTILSRALDEEQFTHMRRRDPFDGPGTRELVQSLMQRDNACVLLSGGGGDLLLGKTSGYVVSLLDHAASGALWPLLHGSFRWARRSQSTIYRVLWTLARAWAGSDAIAAGATDINGDDSRRWNAERVADTFGLTTDFVRRTRPRPFVYLEGLQNWPISKRQLVAGLRRFAATNNFLASDRLHAIRRSFPLVDRRLVEFMFAIPDSVIWKPDRDRALMRGALEGILPERVRQRRTKGYGQPAHLRIVRRLLATLPPARDWLVVQAGYVDYERFTAMLPRLDNGTFSDADYVMRLVNFESWLQQRALGRSPSTSLRKEVNHDDVQQPGFSSAWPRDLARAGRPNDP
jgi:asparagine synthase (glutamine-hydrolysing)